MKGWQVSACVAVLWLGAAACSGEAPPPEPRPLRTDRPMPTYVPPDGDGEPWLEVDVDTDNAVRYRDKIVFDRSVDDPDVLRRVLRSLREQALEQGAVELVSFWTPEELVTVIDGAFLVRGHKWCEWAAVAEVMKAASQPDVGFWKLQLALLAVPE